MNNPLAMAQAKEMREMEETVEVFYTAPVVFMRRVTPEGQPRTAESANDSSAAGYINLLLRDRASF